MATTNNSTANSNPASGSAQISPANKGVHCPFSNVWILTVSSMEQITGAALSTVVGVILPLVQLIWHPGLSSFMQGLVGAIGLIGIGCGSVIIGKIADRVGYLSWFRMCAILVMVGALVTYFVPNVYGLLIGFFIGGFGCGGGYVLDSAYLSELMPKKIRATMIGLAKASCTIGFIGAAFISWFIIRRPDVTPVIWRSLLWILFISGAITFLMRIRWWESPQWLLGKGRVKEAQIAAQHWGMSELAEGTISSTGAKSVSWLSMFKGVNLMKVIYSGIPWACEGLGVYGFGVFLPVLVSALGLSEATAVGVDKVTHSVLITGVVNFFILPGFIIGLLVIKRMNQVKMMSAGFIASAIGLGLLLAAYILKWPAWTMIVGFIIFEVFLNAGPHLLTYIIPAQIYPVEERGTGSGIADLLGKIGAIVGVMLMPVLLEVGGMNLVLIVSIAVMLLGALITVIFGKILKIS